MLDGMTYLFGQILIPMGLVLLSGLVAGWLMRGLLQLPNRARGGAQTSEGDPDTSTGKQHAPDMSEHSEVRDLQATIDRLRDQHETELGRLETGAIEAMENTITRSSQRIEALEEELARVRDLLRRREDELTTQQSQSIKLRQLLQEKDRRIGVLSRPPEPPPL